MNAQTSRPDSIHRFVQGSDASGATLLLLHGTGGNEDDLLPIGPMIAPGASLLSPRGKVLENGMPRFFRRFAEGQFDQQDLAFRTDELARFIQAASDHYGFDSKQLFAVGFSNGANIASSLDAAPSGTPGRGHPDPRHGSVPSYRVARTFSGSPYFFLMEHSIRSHLPRRRKHSNRSCGTRTPTSNCIGRARDTGSPRAIWLRRASG